MGKVITHTALHRRNREMETYKQPNVLIKVDLRGLYVPLNASKISKVH